MSWLRQAGARPRCDMDLLQAGAEHVDRNPALSHLRSMVVVEDRQLLLGRGFGDGEVTRPAQVHSITKSVLSTLYGVALEHGVLDSLHEPVDRHLPAGHPADVSDQLRLWHLLTMTRGTTSIAPGLAFAYDNATAHLAAVVLDAALDGGLEDFARRALFEPLGIEDWTWEHDADGVPRGDWGLSLSPLDLVRFGQLYLDRGRWGERRLLSPRYVDSATRAHSLGGPPEGVPYGLMWWIDGRARPSSYFAGGWAGQHLFVVPEHRLVVVFTGSEEALPEDWDTGRSVFYGWVLPALRHPAAEPG